jgi:hypothetical protein
VEWEETAAGSEELAIEVPAAYTVLRDWGGPARPSRGRGLLLDGGTDHSLQEPAVAASRVAVPGKAAARRAESAGGGLGRDTAPARRGRMVLRDLTLCRRREKRAKLGHNATEEGNEGDDTIEMDIDGEEDGGRSTVSEPGARRRAGFSPAQMLRAAPGPEVLRAAAGPAVEAPPAIRGLVHSRTFLPARPGERHADCSSAWVARQRREDVRDFVDLTEGEKDFMTMWNNFMTEQVPSHLTGVYFNDEGAPRHGAAAPARRPGRLCPEEGGRAAEPEPLPPGETNRCRPDLLSSIESPSSDIRTYLSPSALLTNLCLCLGLPVALSSD